MERSGRGRRGARPPRAARLVAALTAAALLAGCAQIAPVVDWQPPAWPDDSGARLVLAEGAAQGEGGGDGGGAEGGAAGEGGSEAGADAGADSGAGGSAEGVGVGSVAEGATATSGQELGFVERRLRNDRARLQARYVEIPGWHRFNVRMSELLSTAVASTGTVIKPEVFPVSAGLSHGGCVPGSASWPAASVLAEPETGPLDGTGAGTSFVCDITAAFGDFVGVTARTVIGGPESITSDSAVTLYAELSTGAVHESGELWSAEAAEQLWLRAVELLRRQAGGLSAAPVSAPTDEQVALARGALDAARFTESGARFTLPAGIAGPELEGLGIEATTAPIVVEIGAEEHSAWMSELGSTMQAQRGSPFAGLPEWRADQPVDCGLLACVAVTYDDGPSIHTAKLLDTLRTEQSTATFFMVGSSVNALPDVARRVAAEGHGIGSHTMTHADLTTLTPEKARKEVVDVEALLTKLTGRAVGIYRPPYGAVDDKVLAAVGQPAILWSIDTLDWKKPGREELARRSVGVATPGDIILFHDLHAETVENADVVLRGLRDRGFTLVTVEQLFGGSVPAGRVTRR